MIGKIHVRIHACFDCSGGKKSFVGSDVKFFGLNEPVRLNLNDTQLLLCWVYLENNNPGHYQADINVK